MAQLFYGNARPSGNQPQYKCGARSMLSAVKVSNIDDSLEWFGNYTKDGEISMDESEDMFESSDQPSYKFNSGLSPFRQ